jgi:hypothetical protein
VIDLAISANRSRRKSFGAADAYRSHIMTRSLTLDLAEEIDQALQSEAARTGKSREQVALEWIGSRRLPPRGSAEALLSSLGTWSMTPEERSRIEQIIEEERLPEDCSP